MCSWNPSPLSQPPVWRYPETPRFVPAVFVFVVVVDDVVLLVFRV